PGCPVWEQSLGIRPRVVVPRAAECTQDRALQSPLAPGPWGRHWPGPARASLRGEHGHGRGHLHGHRQGFVTRRASWCPETIVTRAP
ncbi:unnamed protein product, partial [Bubo scandiacus]